MIQQLSKAEPKISIQRLCRLLELPISSYYYTPVVRATDKVLGDKMKAIFSTTFHSYGKRRLAFELNKDKSITIGLFKTARLMKQLGLAAKRPKKPHYYTMGKERPTTPNLLKRAFNPTDMNTHWVGDITFIRSHQGWSYLATVMDLGNREIIGYAVSKTPDAQLAKQALTNAIAQHQPTTKGLMFHSDQGVQYTAKLFQETLLNHNIIQSMSRRGCCWDNAVQERFFRNLKTEYLNDLSFINHQSVITAVERYISFYNYKRLNSAINYLTPVEKRKELLKVA